jgi:hypothetical protein
MFSVTSLASRAVVGPRAKGASRAAFPLLCFLDIDVPAVELVAIELLDGFCDGGFVCEFDEGKSPRATSGAIVR